MNIMRLLLRLHDRYLISSEAFFPIISSSYFFAYSIKIFFELIPLIFLPCILSYEYRYIALCCPKPQNDGTASYNGFAFIFINPA